MIRSPHEVIRYDLHACQSPLVMHSLHTNNKKVMILCAPGMSTPNRVT